MKNSFIGFTASALLCAGAGASGELTYTPINPSFGGAALNSSHLLSTANAQRDATARDAVTGSTTGTGTTSPTGTTNADLFVRQLEGRLLSALAGQVTEAIFGTNPSDEGTVTFGTTEVTFVRTVESISLTIVDSLDGTVTEIVVPQLVTGS